MRTVDAPPVLWQPSLLAAGTPSFDPALGGARRRFLGSGAWVDHLPGWVVGADALFDRVRAAAPWHEGDRPMYDRIVAVPRLVSPRWQDPPAVVATMGEALAARYGRALPAISANLYRDGRDSVAWHGDRVGRLRTDTVVAIVSLGATRRLLLRPRGGGRSAGFDLTSGDLLVMGGTCQATWEHCVPKRARAGPRISLMFRETYDLEPGVDPDA